MKKAISSFFVCMFCAASVAGYIDPGTGGMIVGSVWSSIWALFTGALGFIIITFWKPLIKTFKRLFRKEHEKKKS